MKRLTALLLALLPLPSLAPLLSSGFFVTDDGRFHVYRAAALADAWRVGVLHPRLFPDFGFGYGQAVLNFYAPLSYWPPALFSLLGIPPAAAVELTFALGFVLAAWAAYGFARSLWGPWAGLLAAAAYTYFPYHLADVYVRGALPEHFAFIWPPLILWALTELFRRERPLPPLLWGGLAWAGLIYTHNLTALLMMPVAILYVVLLAAWTRGPRRALHAAASLCLGLGLSAPLWLPYFAESRFVGLALGPSDGYRSHLAPLAQLLQTALFYHYRATGVPADLPRADYPLSWPAVLLVVAVLGLFLWRGRGPVQRDLARAVTGFGLLLVVASGLMTSAVSLPVWQPLTPVLGMLQYPWRFMVLVALGMVPVAAALPGLMMGRFPPHPSTGCISSTGLSRTPAQDAYVHLGPWVLLVVALIVQPLPHLPLEPLPLTAADTATPDHMWQEDAAAGQVGATWTGEFLPLTVTEQRWALGRPREGATDTSAPASRPVVTIGQAGYDSLTVEIQTAEATTVHLHQFDLPMWRAQVDDADADAYPTGELGLVSVDVPAGEHRVAFSFGPGSAWHIGGALGLLAALVWAALAFASVVSEAGGVEASAGLGVNAGAGRDRLSTTHLNLSEAAALHRDESVLLRGPRIPWLHLKPQPRNSARWLRIAAAALVMAAMLLALNGWGAGARRWTPQPAQVAVGDVALLVGYDVAPARDAPALDVTLYWYARREVSTNYKTFVHVLDGTGQVIGQHDGEPVGGFTPTTRWRSGEIVVDRHRVPLPAGLSGDVALRAGMYQPEPAQNLPLDPPTADGRIDLGTVTIR